MDLEAEKKTIEALDRYVALKRRGDTKSWLRGSKVKWILKGEIEKLNLNLDNSVPFYKAKLISEWAEEDPWIQERLDKLGIGTC